MNFLVSVCSLQHFSLKMIYCHVKIWKIQKKETHKMNNIRIINIPVT